MKINLGTVLLLLLAFVLGAAFMQWQNTAKGQKELAQMQAILKAKQPAESLLDADLKNATLAEGLQEAQPTQTAPQSGAGLPSQLSPINLEGVSEIYAYKKPDPKNADVQPLEATSKLPAEPVNLSNVEGKVPADTDNAKQAKMPTNITMIEVPVKARVISTGEEYKEFKRVARGSYPAADFETEQVLVLESESNLPDKVFEIADVQIGEDNVVVLYRVNIFGLDEKINTHSAVKIGKTGLPVVLKQVL